MAKNETITISIREIDRLKIIQAVIDRNLKPMQAAKRLGLTTRRGPCLFVGRETVPGIWRP